MPKYTLVKTINADGKSPLFYFEGPSDATEPTDDWITDNSELLQKDTGVRKFKKGNTWEPIASSDGSGGGSSGGGLPINFPTESAANANKLIGFDENGNYTAKEGGESTPTPETILSLTVPQQEVHDGAYVCTIQYADLTQEQQEAVESLAAENYSLFLNTTDRPLTRYAKELAYASYAYNFDAQGPTAEDFFAFSIAYDHEQIGGAVVMSNSDLTGETLNLIGYVEEVKPDYTPLIVNLTLDTSSGTAVLTGDKTYKEIADARMLGKSVLLIGKFDTGELSSSVVDCIREDGSVILYFPSNGELKRVLGDESAYLSFSTQ